MSVIDDIADHISEGGKMPGSNRKSLSEIVKQASDSNRLSKLQRIASEQLAALIPLHISQSYDLVLPLIDCDVVLDDNGHLYKTDRGDYEYASPMYNNLPKERYREVTSGEQRLARLAVEYAKALLEITE